MLAKGDGSPKKKHPEEQNMIEVKKIAKKEMPMTIDEDKRASMTINEGEGSSHTPLYSISQGWEKPDFFSWRNRV